MSKKSFTETTITIKILSEAPISETMELDEIIYESMNGSLVLDVAGTEIAALTPKEAADKLLEVGSEPGFFSLNEDGSEERF